MVITCLELFKLQFVFVALFAYFCFLRLNLKGRREVHASGFCLDDECWRVYEQKVHSVLNQGLSDRTKFIRVTWRNTLSESSIENVWNQVLNFNISFH